MSWAQIRGFPTASSTRTNYVSIIIGKSWPVQLDTYDDVDEYYSSIWWYWNMMEGLSDSSAVEDSEELEYSEGELEEDSEELEDSGEEQSTLIGSH